MSGDINQLPLDAIDPTEGSIEFRSSKPVELLRGPERIIEFVKNGYTFILEAREGDELVFMRGRPHAATRIARHAVSHPETISELFVTLTWAETQDVLYVGDDQELSTVTASESDDIKFHQAPDGGVVQIGDEGVRVAYFHVNEGGAVMESSAKELFDLQLVRASMMVEHCDQLGDFLFETTLVQQTATALVAGLEQYGRDRFVEMEREGWVCDFAGLVDEFVKAQFREQVKTEVQTLAKEGGKSEIAVFVQDQRRINFQAWDRFKDAYKIGYGIMIGDLGLESSTFDALRDTRLLRQRVIHVKGDHTILNREKMPAEEPLFTNKAFGERAREAMHAFGDKLHQATIRT